MINDDEFDLINKYNIFKYKNVNVVLNHVCKIFLLFYKNFDKILK